MSAPNNARKVLRRVISEKISEAPKIYLGIDALPEDIAKISDKIACRLRAAGYKILEQKYNTDDVSTCEEAFREYEVLFEKAGMAINETTVLHQLIAKKIDGATFFERSMDDLSPASNQHIRDDITTRLQITIILKTSKMYKCACGHDETIVTSKQLRCADEPPTVTAKCVRCERKWQVDK